MSRVLLLLLLAISASVQSTNGRTVCGSSGSSPSWQDTYDQQMQDSSDSIDTLGTIGVSCETAGGGYGGYYSSSSSPNYLPAILGVCIPLFIIFWVAVGICLVCAQRQKAANAAGANHNPGQVGEAHTAYGTDEKSHPATMNVQMGQPITNDYKV